MLTLLQLDEFVEECNKHDWTYEFSDDGGVYRRGQQERMALNREAKRDAVLMAAFNAYHNYYFPVLAISAAWPDKQLVRDAIVGGLRHDLKIAATVALINPTKETA